MNRVTPLEVMIDDLKRECEIDIFVEMLEPNENHGKKGSHMHKHLYMSTGLRLRSRM